MKRIERRWKIKLSFLHVKRSKLYFVHPITKLSLLDEFNEFALP